MFMPRRVTTGSDELVVLLGDTGPRRILLATAELSPICRVGGLADATAGLIAALRRLGHHVDVVVPDHDGSPGMHLEAESPLEVPSWAAPAVARQGTIDGVGKVIVVRTPGIERPDPYNDPATGQGWPDNDRRFFGFSAAVAAVASIRQPDVVHLHDWHTAAAVAWLPDHLPVVLSIHNLAYQGDADAAWVDRLGPRGGAFLHHGRCNPLAGGIRRADRVVAVSRAYAIETRRPSGGMGLDALLRQKGRAYLGIHNGIDTQRWDPLTDPFLPAPFSWDELAGKQVCAKELRRTAGLPELGLPLVGVVCRLVEQKGIDVVLDLAGRIDGLDAQLVVMGRGDPAFEAALADAAQARPDRVAYLRETRESLAHLTVAGSDLLLVPSRFEPCGLTPMEAMRCGTIPVVTPVGGLRDSVIDASGDESRGNGFVAPAADAFGVSLALSRALRAWADPVRRTAIQLRGMRADWSWRVPADAYVEVYRDAARVKSADLPTPAEPDPPLAAGLSAPL
jgi:starch synthase